MAEKKEQQIVRRLQRVKDQPVLAQDEIAQWTAGGLDRADIVEIWDGRNEARWVERFPADGADIHTLIHPTNQGKRRDFAICRLTVRRRRNWFYRRRWKQGH